MSLSIKYKLFFAILSAHIIVYAAMYTIGKRQFNQGFIDYLSRIEEQQVPALIDGLQDYYEFVGSWEHLRGNYPMWRILIRDSIVSTADEAELTEDRGVSFNRPFQPSARIPLEQDWYYSPDYSPARPHLLLMDANREIIFGDPEALPLANLNPINVGGETVGYLAVTSMQQLEDQADILFAESQEQSFFLLAVVLVLTSGLIAFPLSSYLVRPIREMVAGTRALISGDYSARLKIRGSDELSRLAGDFNTLAKTLEQNQTARRQWIADISHELRTPLAILRGEQEAVLDGVRPFNLETLKSLQDEVLHLTTLVNDLHELSMSDLGALIYEKEKLDLRSLLEKTIELHHQLIETHRIKVETVYRGAAGRGAIHIFADANRIKQLLVNLLQNTCRYTNDGGKLKIVVTEHADTVTIKWEDSEPGVDDRDLEILFDRLYRVERSRNRAGGGSGLGLTICKNIVEAHEGTIRAEHSELGGLKLIIELPKRSV